MTTSRAASPTSGFAAACPCGSAASYDGCCGPLHRNERQAATAEELMRSRYSAFAVGDADHLFRSWHPRTRPATVEVADGTTWTGLVVESTSAGGPEDLEGTVTFRAAYHTAEGARELRERSRFVRRAGRWVYLDGASS